jgi:hypothetical protein
VSARDHALGGGPGRSGAAVVRLTTAKAFDPRTRVLLEGPITATLLKLAAPNVLVMVAQTSVGLIETYSSASSGLMCLPASRSSFPW